MKPCNVLALAFAASVGLAATAHGQTPPPAAPPPLGASPQGAPPHAWRPQGRHGPGERRPEGGWGKRLAARATALHNVLGIRPDQETAFQAYALPQRPTPAGGPDGQGWRRPGDAWKAAPTAMTAPERAEAMLKRFDDRAARMRERLARRAAAVKTLYAALSPDQRRVFDALPELKGAGGGEGGWGRHGGEGHPPHGPGEGMGE